MELVDEKLVEADELSKINEEQQHLIVVRANELKEKYPEKANLFENYIFKLSAEEVEKAIDTVKNNHVYIRINRHQ